jgi:hypothetical protein
MAQESIEVGGHSFVLYDLPFKESRKAQPRIMKLAGMYDNEDVNDVGLGLFMFAGLVGALGDDDLEYFCQMYGRACEVIQPGTSNQLKFDDKQQEALFKGNLKLMYAWLDSCTAFHFGDVLKDYASAQARMAEKVRSKAKSPTHADPSSQPE